MICITKVDTQTHGQTNFHRLYQLSWPAQLKATKIISSKSERSLKFCEDPVVCHFPSCSL